jgi:nucleoside-diphosphate-sugar epimerase
MKKISVNKTAIVIGATGLIGSNVVTSLAEAEHVGRVVVITRRAVEYNSEKVENHVIDFDHLSDHEELLSIGSINALFR